MSIEKMKNIDIYVWTNLSTNSIRNLVRKLLGKFDIKSTDSKQSSQAEIIEELIRIAEEIKNADRRGEELGLSEDELAFYDALEPNGSAVKKLGDETLKTIARELANELPEIAEIDWTLKESAYKRLMVHVRRTLNKYGYPQDKKQRAVEMVMKQAENLADIWAVHRR